MVDGSDDNIVDPKPGTLRHAVIQKGPLWIIFAYNMVIRLQQELMVTSDKTIDGRGGNVVIAFGGGITLQYVNNIIIMIHEPSHQGHCDQTRWFAQRLRGSCWFEDEERW